MPLLLRYLLEVQGYYGTCLIFAGLLLNTSVAALLFHPLEWHAKKAEEPIQLNDELKSLTSILKIDSRVDLNASLARLTITDTTTKPIRRQRSRLNSLSSDVYFATSSVGLSAINISNISYDNLNFPSKRKEEKKRNICNSICLLLKNIVMSVFNYLKILKHTRAIIIAFAMSVYFASFGNFIMMAPFALQNAGFSLEESTYCVSAISCANMICRGILPIASDYPIINKRLIFMTGASVLTICTFGMLLMLIFIYT